MRRKTLSVVVRIIVAVARIMMVMVGGRGRRGSSRRRRSDRSENVKNEVYRMDEVELDDGAPGGALAGPGGGGVGHLQIWIGGRGSGGVVR